MRRAEIIPDQLDAMDALEILRSSDVPMLLVHDEYGHFEGIVTPADILETITGVFKADTGGDEHHLGDEPDRRVDRLAVLDAPSARAHLLPLL